MDTGYKLVKPGLTPAMKNNDALILNVIYCNVPQEQHCDMAVSAWNAFMKWRKMPFVVMLSAYIQSNHCCLSRTSEIRLVWVVQRLRFHEKIPDTTRFRRSLKSIIECFTCHISTWAWYKIGEIMEYLHSSTHIRLFLFGLDAGIITLISVAAILTVALITGSIYYHRFKKKKVSHERGVAHRVFLLWYSLCFCEFCRPTTSYCPRKKHNDSWKDSQRI